MIIFTIIIWVYSIDRYKDIIIILCIYNDINTIYKSKFL